MRIECPSREKIERDVRETLARRGVPCMLPIHDGPPVFDAENEQKIATLVADIERAWLTLLATPINVMLKPFDVSDLQAAERECLGDES